jgi:hypothetical protein
MLEPAAQFAGRQRRIGQRAQQLIRMLSVGARQRHHDPAGRPTRQRAVAHRGQGRIRQSRQQLQAPADPAHVTPTSARQIVLGQSQALHQLAYQQGFFDARQWAILRARQQTQQRIGQVAGPLLDAGGVATEATQGGDTPITVDEHQPFAASAGTAGNRHRNAWNDLPAALDRMGDPRHGARFHQAAASKAQLQAVQIEFQALAVHGRDG